MDKSFLKRAFIALISLVMAFSALVFSACAEERAKDNGGEEEPDEKQTTQVDEIEDDDSIGGGPLPI